MDFIAPKLLMVAALAMTLIAALFDWKKGTIPPWISLGLLPIAPIWHAWAMRGKHAPFDLPGPLFGGLLSMAGALSCALVPYLLFLFRCGGGGDVKLLASLGALLGPHWALPAEFYALVLAALYAPLRLAYQGRLFTTVFSSATALVGPLLPRAHRHPVPDALFEGIRLSPFVFLGTIASLAASSLVPRVMP